MPLNPLAKWITPSREGHTHKFAFGDSKTTNVNGHTHTVKWHDGTAVIESSGGHDHGYVFIGTADHGK